MTAFVLLVGLFASSQPDLDWLFSIAVFMGLTIGLVWLISFWIAAMDTRLQYTRRVWARWAGIPVMCFVCLTIVWSGMTMTARFQLSRPAFEQVATRVQAGDHYGSGWIGFYSVNDVRAVGKTTVFVLSGSFADGCGLAYPVPTADFTSWANDFWTLTDWGNGWSYWCNGFSNFSD